MNTLVRSCLMLVMVLTACNLFKKTSKMTAAEMRQVKKKRDFNMLELKSANRQTSIFTLWDSGRVHQHQLIMEQIDESKLAGMQTTEQDTAKKELLTRETTPPDLWIYTGLAVFLIGGYWIYRRLRSRYTV